MLLCAAPILPLRGAPSSAGPSLVLITLDTTRADYVGRVEEGSSLTPSLDALARGGVRFARALSPAPLTLPAHCTLMTGRNPPAHGVRDNGVSALAADIPTLASVLSGHGYRTAAFVSSRVLDRRFGLDRGFRIYDDAMVAENMGEQGYPERDAAAVTNAAVAWARRPERGPYFLWVHYYDPHAPYRPPGDWTGKSAARRYAGEIAYMDREIGRLLRELPPSPEGRVVAAVGDHGEMLGEHGEKDHGVFLYRSALEVPLILSGPRVPAGKTVGETVGTRGLASTLLILLGLPADAHGFGPGLPGIDAGTASGRPSPVYAETLLPADAYGWSPLFAASDDRWRLIRAPRSELYDFVADPAESRNVIADHPDEVRRLQRAIDEARAAARGSGSALTDSELAASLRSLGYLGGASRTRAGGLDPKDGIALLSEFEYARKRMDEGQPREAAALFEALVQKSPGNVPFLLHLGDAQLGAGLSSKGLKSLAEAVALNPELDFLWVRLAQAHAETGDPARARSEYEEALRLNPRSAPAWSGLAEIARRTGTPGEELLVLQKSEAAGTRSASLLSRQAALEEQAGDHDAARRHAAEAAAMRTGP